jgi:hypothetical protein
MPPKKVKDENTVTKDLIKKVILELLKEDKSLSIDKETNNKIKKVNNEIKQDENKPKRDILIDYFEMTLYEILEFNDDTNLKGLKENYDDVEKFMKLQRDYPNLNSSYFGTTDYVVYKNYLDDYYKLVSIILDAKKKIVEVIGEGKYIEEDCGLNIDSDEDEEEED